MTAKTPEERWLRHRAEDFLRGAGIFRFEKPRGNLA
jgi:hypothetical protein